MKQNYDNSSTENIDKESWQRSTHILNMITAAQVLIMQGELMQNPYYISSGCGQILDLIGPMYNEKTEKEDKKKGKIEKKGAGGKDTERYKTHITRLAEAKGLINMYLQGTYDNGQELMDEAYRILNTLKTDLFQDIDKMNLNFKKKPDVYEEWQN